MNKKLKLKFKAIDKITGIKIPEIFIPIENEYIGFYKDILALYENKPINHIEDRMHLAWIKTDDCDIYQCKGKDVIGNLLWERL